MTDHINEIILKYLIGNISKEELGELETWLNHSAANKAAFEEIKTAWVVSRSGETEKIKGKNRVWKNVLNKTDDLKKNYKQIQRKQQTIRLLRAAVVFIALVFGATIMYLTSTYITFDNSPLTNVNEPIHNDTILIEANKGSRSEVILPDGSKVWLNGGSQLKMLPEFYKGKRTVFLIGEAFFDITKKGKDNFFRVKTSDIQIKVLGTQFNLKSYPEEGTVETTLEEGSVVIEKETEERLISIATLSPNEKAIFIKKEGRVSIDGIEEEGTNEPLLTQKKQRKESVVIRENIDTKLYTSWKEGHLIFKDESLKNIVVKMERWYDVKINIENPILKYLQFTANFKNETIGQALYALKLTHNFIYKHDIEKNLITIE